MGSKRIIIKNINDFVDYLAEMRTPDESSTNIYAGKSDDAKIRRKNLLLYLKKMEALNPTHIFIGEAPGFHGCGKTGIPFTDEFAIATEDFFANEEFRNLGLEKERSAAIIWTAIKGKKEMPFLWNIYPFHPHNESLQSNRTPSAKEIQMGKDILMELLYLFKFENFHCIGKSSYNALKDIIPDAEYIRHPSHGGMKECMAKIDEVLE
ncbi:MAG: uracil-DNA glycosylase [Prevotellaceae bacterium]|nr:uracil-DNA glycosylase [Prevotellaceae bacterium]